jgi:predicted outer membrane protein
MRFKMYTTAALAIALLFSTGIAQAQTAPTATTQAFALEVIALRLLAATFRK